MRRHVVILLFVVLKGKVCLPYSEISLCGVMRPAGKADHLRGGAVNTTIIIYFQKYKSVIFVLLNGTVNESY